MIKKILIAILLMAYGYLFWHNISIYNPKNGFDGEGHMSYINYILTNNRLPQPHEGWELNQPPVYYLLAAPLHSSGIKPQIINVISFFIIAFLLYRLTKSYLATLAFAALPMSNYLVPLITNEYLSGLLGIVLLLILLHLSISKGKDRHLKILLFVSFALAFLTKVTALMFIPLIPLTLFIKKDKKWISRSVILTLMCVALVSPLIINNFIKYGKPLVINDDFVKFTGRVYKRDLSFFFSPMWIIKPDLYDAHSYSFTGGLWNTLWHDGEHVTTPAEGFQAKPFALWLLGFPFLAISTYGLFRFIRKNRKQGIVLISYLGLSLIVLVLYNFRLPYNNVLKTFFVFPIVVPYVLGIVEAGKSGKFTYITPFLLIVQYLIMYSWFYIQPWWYVAQ